MQSTRSVEPPDRGAAGGSGAFAGRAQAATRKRALAATIAERSVRRAAGAGLAVLPPPAPESRAVAADARAVRESPAVAADARAVRQARRDIDRWVDDGGLVQLEADALTRRTMSRR
jgi:hypothetical protein